MYLMVLCMLGKGSAIGGQRLFDIRLAAKASFAIRAVCRVRAWSAVCRASYASSVLKNCRRQNRYRGDQLVVYTTSSEWSS
jgi:hypothetical protein